MGSGSRSRRRFGRDVGGVCRFCRDPGRPPGDEHLLASAVGGTTFGKGPAAVPVGVLVLLAGTILWAFGYLYAARKQAQLLTRPLVSGTGFGVIVWFVMQAVLVGAGHFSAPTIYTFDRDMVAFIVFFGIPLAVTASRLVRVK